MKLPSEAFAGPDLEAIIIAIARLFAERGIDFAYPTQTTFTAAPDGTLVMPWAAPKA